MLMLIAIIANVYVAGIALMFIGRDRNMIDGGLHLSSLAVLAFAIMIIGILVWAVV